MFAWAPWSLARGTAAGRRAVLLFALAALLYGFGMHAARACVPTASAPAHQEAAVGGQPCHGDHVVDVAKAACEAHCRADAQSGRPSPSFDLPAAAPISPPPSLAPVAPIGPLALDLPPPRRDGGPPLHLLLHRLLR